MRKQILLAAALLAIMPSASAALTMEQKQQDINALCETLQEIHPGLFTDDTSQTAFETQKTALQNRMADLDDPAFRLALQSLIASAGDSQTTATLYRHAATRVFPVSLRWLEDGWYLTSVPQEQAGFLGQPVTALNGVPMAEVTQRVSTLVSADNAIHLRYQTGQILPLADILEYTGILSDGGDLTITTGQGALTVSPLPAQELAACPVAKPLKIPPTAYDSSRSYFSRPLDNNIYYIQYNQCREDPALSMEHFTAQVAADLQKNKYQQVCIDLRYNTGGSDLTIVPLLSLLADGVRNGQYQLWGLVGETTAAAAVMNALEIKETGGFLAGTPTGGSVDHFGAARTFTLPHSGLQVSCPAQWLDMADYLEAALPYGREPLLPDIHSGLSVTDYLAGKDTAVEYLAAHGTDPINDVTIINHAVLSRGGFLAMLYEAAQKPAVVTEQPFDDVMPFAYYAPAIAWAAQQQIVNGTGNGRFSPARPVTRAEAAVMIARYVQSGSVPATDRADAYAILSREEGRELIAAIQQKNRE